MLSAVFLLSALASLGSVAAGPAAESATNVGTTPVVATAQSRSLANLVAGLDDYRVLLVGETHTRNDHHQLQLAVLDLARERTPNIAIGVEWFQHPFQPVLDDFVAGRIDEATMLERSGYYDRWRFDYRLYRPILQYARDHRIPIIALNAPLELTNRIAEVGVDGLSAEERQDLPKLDRSDTAYERRLEQFFASHPSRSQDASRFIEVQLTWDETMAYKAAEYVKAHPGRRLVVFAGRGHIDYGSGIPDRLQRRLGQKQAVIVPHDGGVLDPAIADFVAFTRPAPLPSEALLGLFLEPAEGGMKVVRLADESAAKSAGVVTGDLLLQVDGQPTTSLARVKLALAPHTSGDDVEIKVRHRNWLGQEQEKTLAVALP